MPELTMLNSMASKHFETALDQLLEWGITKLDLKDSIFGKSVIDLNREETEQVAAMVKERRQLVYCMSTAIFQDDIEQGEVSFRMLHERWIEQALKVALVLRPRLVRVLSAQSSKRSTFKDSIGYLEAHHPWVFELYRSTIDRFDREGITLTIENDPQNNIFGSPVEILRFFELLNRRGKTHFTFDVQNLWQMGVFPEMGIYTQLKPLIGFLHVKGGIMNPLTKELQWKSSLEDASWPVAEMCRQAISDGTSPVICLNPSHGAIRPGYDYNHVVKRDIDFLRSLFPK
ncbi:MAG: xylose isomerase-like barrel [Paenibacillus sp.]|nr:xylose isomerase-like barrel [Paenibacillus sp.]